MHSLFLLFFFLKKLERSRYVLLEYSSGVSHVQVIYYDALRQRIIKREFCKILGNPFKILKYRLTIIKDPI